MIVELQKLNDMLGALMERADSLALGTVPISGLDLIYKVRPPRLGPPTHLCRVPRGAHCAPPTFTPA